MGLATGVLAYHRRTMLRREVAISRADVSLLQRNVKKLGGYAVTLLERHDLGMDPSLFREHLTRTYEQLGSICQAKEPISIRLHPMDFAHGNLVEPVDLPWNYPQTLRFASGACMISEEYRRWMTPENMRRSLTAKVLYKCQTGILDDVVDKGDYNYLEAKGLYHLVLSSMTDPALDPNTFMKKLMAILRQEQLEHFDLITAISNNFNILFSVSPHGKDLFYQMENLDEKVALGQALTMFQKESHFDLGQVASISRGFSTLDEEFRWYERLANYVSGGTRYNLIDISFIDRKMQERRTQAVLKGWFYFDAVIVFLNNVVSIYEDLRNGIANLSLVAMREKEVLPLTTLSGYDPGITAEDYVTHLERLARLASKGLERMAGGLQDVDQYYPFIAVMMPVVMLAEWIGSQDELLDIYLEALAPSIRRAAERGIYSAPRIPSTH